MDVGPEGEIDLVAFFDDVSAGRRARTDGDSERAIADLRSAVERYTGELLPEEGAIGWVMDLRDRSRQMAAESAECLAELLLEQRRPEESAQACAAGLRIDRYSDALWRLMVQARRRAGDPMAAHRAQVRYERMLAELGIGEDARPTAV
jgi:two-component SAPR family response regulator